MLCWSKASIGVEKGLFIKMHDANLNYIGEIVENIATDICNDTNEMFCMEDECKTSVLSLYQALVEDYCNLKTEQNSLYRHEHAACLIVAVQRLRPLKKKAEKEGENA